MGKKIEFHGCKHLDFEEHYHKCIKKDFHGMFVYWERSDDYCHDNIRKNVQFCKLRGRLNDKGACTEAGGAECSEYENMLHIVEVPEDKENE